MTGGRRGQQWLWAEIAAVVTLALIATALRAYRLDLGWFGVDQARDISIGLDVAAGQLLPTIGPTMRRVTRLGALYYYFWALPYLVWRDPLAGYGFAALLSTSAVVLTWALARRLWGPLAAVVTLAVAASHPVWVLDGRIAWAPAALPAATIVLLWLATGARGSDAPLSSMRAAVLGAVLGLAVQLHLAMVPWLVAVLFVLFVDRMPARAWLGCAIAFALVASPAAWAVLAPTPTESGVAALAGEHDHGGVLGRLIAIATLPMRVPGAVSQWSGVDPSGGTLATVATIVIAAAVLLGLLRLAIGMRGAARAVRIAVLATFATLALVALIPGSPWYYYLDALLPVWALAAGALVASAQRAAGAVAGARAIVAAILVVAALGVAGRMSAWLAAAVSHEYVAVDPALLSLAARPGRDAAVPGRLVSLGVKRALAERIAAAWSAMPPSDAAPPSDGESDFGALWHRLHGPAWEDATGDNGFWLRRAHRPRSLPPESPRQLALWYRDDPVAAALGRLPPSAVLTLTTIGPLVLAEYVSAIDYPSCASGAAALTVPVRVVPHPQRYGDGTPPKPDALPSPIECRLARDRDLVEVVAALSGPGKVEIVAGYSHGEGAVAATCVPPPAPSFRLTIEVPQAGATALDVYEVPGAVGCVSK